MKNSTVSLCLIAMALCGIQPSFAPRGAGAGAGRYSSDAEQREQAIKDLHEEIASIESSPAALRAKALYTEFTTTQWAQFHSINTLSGAEWETSIRLLEQERNSLESEMHTVQNECKRLRNDYAWNISYAYLWQCWNFLNARINNLKYNKRYALKVDAAGWPSNENAELFPSPNILI